MNRPIRTLRHALTSVFAHRVRSTLAMIGVAIGIAAVVLTQAIGQGAQSDLLARFGTMGTRLLVVRPSQLKRTPARRQIQGYASTLKLDDYTAIASLPNLDASAPIVEGAVKIETDQGVVATQVLGTTAAFFAVRHFELDAGRAFDDDDDRANHRRAVLGGRIARSLFPVMTAVGGEIRIAGSSYEVIGTLASKGPTADGADADNQVFIPVRTAMRRLFDARSLSAIFVGTRQSEDLDAVEASIRALLRERHALDKQDKPDDFSVQSQARVLEAQRRVTEPLVLFVSALGALSLLVGGTGILALMILSVQERRPEIGLRVAVGATSADILVQFLTESLVLALVGGAVGFVAGSIGIEIVAYWTHWPMHISMEGATMALATSVTIGVVFGAWPAGKAAKLPPVEALKTE